jgi:hypothetical protein
MTRWGAFGCVLGVACGLALASAPAAQSGTVGSEQISETAGGFGGVLEPGDDFGLAISSLGDRFRPFSGTTPPSAP